MTTYIALLRGINVGGHHKVPMADLRAAFEAHGATGVSTYIQSGNVVFAHDAAERALAADLSSALEDRFGFPIPVVVRAAEELPDTSEDHPLAHLDVEEKLLHVVFLSETPPAGAEAGYDAEKYEPDQVLLRGRELYIAYPNGSGRSKLTLDVLERAFGSPATARNWRTVGKLAEMAAALEEGR